MVRAEGVAAVRNNKTGATSKVRHHCSECNRPPSKECFNKYHRANCEVCGEQFNVKSRGGCSQHEYRDGFNKRYVNIRRGLDPDFKSDWELDQEAKVKAEEDAAAARLAKEISCRPYDTDWSRPQFREKPAPREKTKDNQGKKQPAAPDLKSLRHPRKHGD